MSQTNIEIFTQIRFFAKYCKCLYFHL